jgi:hypothetical protein
VKHAVAKALLVAVVGLTPITFATVAHASGVECEDDWIGDDGSGTTVCDSVNGSGLWVNWNRVSASDANGSESTPSDTWFPTDVNCNVQAGWISFNTAGSGTSHWTGNIKCASFKSAGGYVFSVNANVSSGKVCGYLYFPEYGQETGGRDCVGVHS